MIVRIYLACFFTIRIRHQRPIVLPLEWLDCFSLYETEWIRLESIWSELIVVYCCCGILLCSHREIGNASTLLDPLVQQLPNIPKKDDHVMIDFKGFQSYFAQLHAQNLDGYWNYPGTRLMDWRMCWFCLTNNFVHRVSNSDVFGEFIVSMILGFGLILSFVGLFAFVFASVSHCEVPSPHHRAPSRSIGLSWRPSKRSRRPNTTRSKPCCQGARIRPVATVAQCNATWKACPSTLVRIDEKGVIVCDCGIYWDCAVEWV